MVIIEHKPHGLWTYIIQGIGLVLLLVFSGVWVFTGQESVMLVGASGSLILLGGAERLRIYAVYSAGEES